MSRIAYFQAFSGASGDMFLGSLVDAGWPVDDLVATLSKLPVHGYRVNVENVVKGAVAATSVSFEIEAHDHAHRGLRDILAILDGSDLGDSVRDRVSSMFERLARVEARVHGETVEDIHFHEVGAVDSILDVVGAAAGLEWLDADEIVVSPINTGGSRKYPGGQDTGPGDGDSAACSGGWRARRMAGLRSGPRASLCRALAAARGS